MPDEEFICPKCNKVAYHKVVKTDGFEHIKYVYECSLCGNWTDQDIVDMCKEGIELLMPELCCEAVERITNADNL